MTAADNNNNNNNNRNFHEIIFLKAWYSQKDHNAGNEHIDNPDVYESLP